MTQTPYEIHFSNIFNKLGMSGLVEINNVSVKDKMPINIASIAKKTFPKNFRLTLKSIMFMQILLANDILRKIRTDTWFHLIFNELHDRKLERVNSHNGLRIDISITLSWIVTRFTSLLSSMFSLNRNFTKLLFKASLLNHTVWFYLCMTVSENEFHLVQFRNSLKRNSIRSEDKGRKFLETVPHSIIDGWRSQIGRLIIEELNSQILKPD